VSREDFKDAGEGVVEVFARYDQVYHAMVFEVFRCLEVSGQLFANGFLNDAGARKADGGFGLGQGEVPEHGEGGRNAPERGVGQNNDIGELCFPNHLDGHRGAGHLHEG